MLAAQVWSATAPYYVDTSLGSFGSSNDSHPTATATVLSIVVGNSHVFSDGHYKCSPIRFHQHATSLGRIGMYGLCRKVERVFGQGNFNAHMTTEASFTYPHEVIPGKCRKRG